MSPRGSAPTRWIGRWIMAVGAIHAAFGALVFGEALAGIVRDGVWNAVDGHQGRPLAFWFVFLGLLTIVLGALVDWVEGCDLPFPNRFAWGLSILVMLAIVAMPIGGGWLLLPAAVGAVARSRSRKPKPS